MNKISYNEFRQVISSLKNVPFQFILTPSFYSGRGATRGDLAPQHLDAIHKWLNENVSKEASKEFVNLVDNIKVMSATAFGEDLISFYHNDFKNFRTKDSKPANEISVSKNKDGEYDENSINQGMLGIMAMMGNSGRDDTQSIKGSFLMKHGIKPQGEFIDSHGYYYNY